MKKLFFIASLLLFTISISHSEEILDCDEFEKTSAKFLECKAKKLKSSLNKQTGKIKSKLNKKQKIAKENIESNVKNIDSSEIKKKFDGSKLKKALLKIKNSKTGSDLLNKE